MNQLSEKLCFKASTLETLVRDIVDSSLFCHQAPRVSDTHGLRSIEKKSGD